MEILFQVFGTGFYYFLKLIFEIFTNNATYE